MKGLKWQETYYSTDYDTEIIVLKWSNIAGTTNIWKCLFNLLTTLCDSQSSFREISGRFTVNAYNHQSSSEILGQESWLVTIDSEGLKTLEDRYNLSLGSGKCLKPDTMTLRCATDLLLPTQVKEVRIFAFDYADSENYELLHIEPSSTNNLPEGYTAWQTTTSIEEPEEKSDLYIEITCNLDQSDTHVKLSLRSRLDIWRIKGFDGFPNGFPEELNFYRLQEEIQQIAQKTGGKLIALAY